MSAIDTALLKETGARFGRDNVGMMASSLAYTALFSIAPLFIIVIAIAGWAVGVTNGGHGHHIVEDRLLGFISGSAGPGAADAVRAMIKVAFNKPGQSIVAQIIGWLTFIIGASGFALAVENALNIIWESKPEKTSLVKTIFNRFIALAGMVGFVLVLLATTGASAVLSFAAAHLPQPFAGAGIVFTLLNLVVTAAVLAGCFAVVFKVVPTAKIGWRDVWPGAIATSVLFVVGQLLVGIYLGRAGLASGYGAAGSLVVFLVWMYYSSLILLLGAEFTRVFAERHGSRKGQAVETVKGESQPARAETAAQHPTQPDSKPRRPLGYGRPL